MSKGLFVALVGPSGVGKGTIMDMLRQKFTNGVFVLSHTTRNKRPGEEDGKQYFFVSEEEFKKGIAEEKFLEWALVHKSDYYGILREPVEKALQEGKIIFREVDVQGVNSIKKIIPKDHLLTIFIKPESLDVLRSRIEHRGAIPEEEMQRRLESAAKEITFADQFDYQITNYNDRLLACYMDIEGIIISRAEQMGIALSGGGVRV